MANAQVRITGDASGAVGAIDQVANASRQASGAIDQMAISTGQANNFVFGLAATMNDVSQFSYGFSAGIRAISNNIVFLLPMLATLKGGLGTIVTALKGPAGLVLAISTALTVMTMMGNSAKEAAQEVEELNKAANSFLKIIELPDGLKIMAKDLPEAIKLQQDRIADLNQQLASQQATMSQIRNTNQEIPAFMMEAQEETRGQIEDATALLNVLEEQSGRYEEVVRFTKEAEASGLARLNVEDAVVSAYRSQAIELQKVQAARFEGLGQAQAGEGTIPTGGLSEMESTVSNMEDLNIRMLAVSASMSYTIGELGPALAGGLVNAATAFASGEATFSQAVGGLLTNFGQSLVGLGIAGVSIKTFVKDPLLAIAAGSGLIVLGKRLSSKAARLPSQLPSGIGATGRSFAPPPVEEVDGPFGALFTAPPAEVPQLVASVDGRDLQFFLANTQDDLQKVAIG